MALRNVALRKGTTPAQSALAWLLAKKPWIVPIRNRTRLEENAGAMLLQLTADEMIAIEHAIATHSVEGDRYDERGLKTVNL